MNPIKERNEKLGNAVVANLKKRHFDAYFCETAKEAVDTALSLIPKGASVSWGGSASIAEIGLIDALYNSGEYNILDRSKVSPDNRRAFQKEAMFCHTFLSSANAITEDGEIVNVDGNGNRVSAIIFGPESVIIIAGMNKVVKTVDDAISRARTVAAPINSQRFDIDTPCKTTGYCTNCKSRDSICATIVTNRLCKPAGRIKVILVNKNLGF